MTEGGAGDVCECGGPLPLNEAAAYNGRCENCFAGAQGVRRLRSSPVTGKSRRQGGQMYGLDFPVFGVGIDDPPGRKK